MTTKHAIVSLLLLICSFSIAKAEKANRTPISSTLTEKEKRKFDYFFLEALKLKQSQQYDQSFEMLLHALSIDSTAAAAYYEISNYYLFLDKTNATINALSNAVKYDNKRYDYKIALANITRELGMNDESVTIYEELIKKYPDKPELNFYLSDLYTREGEIDKAIKALDDLETNVGMSEALSMQKFQLYNVIEQKDQAFKEIEKLAAKYPMEAKYQIVMGDLYLKQDQPDKAYACYQKAYQIDPQNPYYVVSMSNYYEYKQDAQAATKEIDNALRNPKLDVDTKLAILTRYIQNLQQNKKDVERANALFQTLMGQHPLETELNMMYGSFLLSQNKKDDAKFQFQIVTESSPENINAWKQLLSIALQENDMDGCIEICDKALFHFPDAPEFYFYKGLALYQKEDSQKALDTYLEGLSKIKPEDRSLSSDFYGQIGDLYHNLKEKEKAYEAYDKALEYNDKNIGVLNNYAYFLSLDKKDLSKAERMSSICVKLQPDNSTYLDTYAWIFFVQGNYSLAKFYIESALSKDGDKSAEIIDHYGDILFKTGDVDNAIKQWEKAVELGKDTPILKKKIADKKYYEDEIQE